MTTTLESPARLPAPVAARVRRPSWRDPRLLIGFVLVAASVVLGATVVSSARGTTPVYVAAKDLVPGDHVDASALHVVDMNLGDEAGTYASPQHPLTAGAVVTRVVHSGELVPTSAVGAAGDVDLEAVSVPVGGTLSDRVETGAAVDVWYVPKQTGDGQDADTGKPVAPRKIATAAIVEKVDEPGGELVVGGTTTVHVLVTAKELPGVLAALAAEGSVTVVPGGAR